jgi:hypothetical protein
MSRPGALQVCSDQAPAGNKLAVRARLTKLLRSDMQRFILVR